MGDWWRSVDIGDRTQHMKIQGGKEASYLDCFAPGSPSTIFQRAQILWMSPILRQDAHWALDRWGQNSGSKPPEKNPVCMESLFHDAKMSGDLTSWWNPAKPFGSFRGEVQRRVQCTRLRYDMTFKILFFLSQKKSRSRYIYICIISICRFDP